ncbi:MAG: GDP-L-fucose synthase [Cyclobacteriaceae bacterium]|nr:GDP-L-fucose synthase [Cyclobacteriaceae bacterium HetDA_MAG_MS6]
MNKSSKIYIAGHRGMVGSAIVRRLEHKGYNNLVFKTSQDLDLTSQSTVQQFFDYEKPEYVFLAAAKVGGINANNVYRGQFLYENLMIQSNVIHHAYQYGVKKLLFLGSSCIYPKLADQPIHEDSLLTGPLEPTNEPYAIAKITGIKLCETYRHQYGADFISAMPTNLYGPNDNYDLEKSHVLPALIRKFHVAKVNRDKTVEIWGSGKPLREFLHVDDLAEACIFLMKNYADPKTINVGFGEDITIKELAELVADIVGFTGELVFNANKPDGTPRKLMDSSRIRSLGWQPRISLREGIEKVYTEVDKSGW